MGMHPEQSNRTAYVSETDVHQAQARCDELRRIRDEAKAQLAEIVKHQKKLQFEIRVSRSNLDRRHFYDRTMTRTGGFINYIVVSSALALIFTSLLSLPTAWRIGLTLVGAALGAPMGAALLLESDDEIASRINRCQEELDGLSPRMREASEEAARTQEAFQVAETHYLRLREAHQSRINQLREAHQSRINQLLDCHWQGMAGVEFEEFLAAVFQELGYRVETTKVTGDQGVDLVVSKDGRKAAIQAKGYPGSTVGNKAVQEVHTGKTFYGCQFAVVITNSAYTSAARELAAKVGCVLIEKNQIPELIEGRLRIS